MAQISFIPSGRGGEKALYRGFVYTKHRDGQSCTFWHCIARREKCKGRIKVDSTKTVVEVLKNHDHLPDFGLVKAKKLLAKAKKRCLDEPHVIPPLVSQETFSAADAETLAALPKETSIKAAIRRLRRKNLPEIPVTLDRMENIPEAYQSLDNAR